MRNLRVSNSATLTSWCLFLKGNIFLKDNNLSFNGGLAVSLQSFYLWSGEIDFGTREEEDALGKMFQRQTRQERKQKIVSLSTMIIFFTEQTDKGAGWPTKPAEWLQMGVKKDHLLRSIRVKK